MLLKKGYGKYRWGPSEHYIKPHIKEYLAFFYVLYDAGISINTHD